MYGSFSFTVNTHSLLGAEESGYAPKHGNPTSTGWPQVFEIRLPATASDGP